MVKKIIDNIKKKAIVWGLLILSLLGFLDAIYLSAKKIFSSPINCFVFEGCQNVTNSPYAYIVGIPLSYFGAAFYLLMFILAVRYLEKGNQNIFKLLFYLSMFSVLFAAYLLILQFIIIKYLCIYCLFSALISVGIFGLGLLERKLIS